MKARRYMKPWLLLTGVAVLAVLVLAACGGSSAGSGASTPASSPTSAIAGSSAVSIADFAFSPPTLTVKAGTTVTWTNNDGAPHTVTSTNNDGAPHTVTSTDGPSTSAQITGAFDSGDLGQGETFSFTFDKAGTYYYDCTIHAAQASMHGIVVVQ